LIAVDFEDSGMQIVTTQQTWTGGHPPWPTSILDLA
jgi:hypothetical protein